MSQTSNKPVKVFHRRGVRASVFANQTKTEGREVTFHKVSLQRVFREGEEFKTTTNLGRDDVPIACLLLQKAWEFILDQEAEK